jgi:DNA-directed RNA polymerase subunit N (RpoN/RPB10)
MGDFKKWLINEDIFGFEKYKKPIDKTEVYDGPLSPIAADTIMESMMGKNIQGQEAFSDFHDQVQWGRHPGAVRMVISPLGSYKSIIRKLQINLEGTENWVCKKIIPYKNMLHTTFSFDEHLAEEMFEKIENIYKEQINAPSKEYNNLEKLVVQISKYCCRADIIPEIFIHKGIKKKSNENYLIVFECKGHGVEAPDSMRLEQFIIEMSYKKSTGMIRSFGYGVQSPTRQHLWRPQPSEWDEFFSSGQSEKEIVEAIGSVLSTY